MPIVRRRLSAAERTVNPGGCLLREEELAMIVIPASRLDGRLAGGIHEVAVASMSIDAQAHPSNTKRLLTKASRLENQNVSVQHLGAIQTAGNAPRLVGLRG